ncbi:MAG TPA: LysE family translocator [Ramlibacter sp.]|uniref:LysE family translocator n=1 Tax=Ramlibacter sp. TaxID=1917967 RepID=UPI002D7E4DFE|nr:LysE family translocator [Ramlibacter sp.]HET8748450.1 LysE family translocator [Ramlibacter sp.]
MPDAQHLLLFVAAGILLNLTPGPDVLYIVSHAIRRGGRAGVVATLGVSAGCFVHIVAAAVGVSALLAASATAFTVLKWAGAAYLVYVGVRLLLAKGAQKRWAFAGAPAPAYEQPVHEETAREKVADEGGAREGTAGLWEVFRGGFLTNALNPKVAIFFLAFVPQFIAPQAEHKALAFLALGLLFNVNTLAVNALWALAAAWVARTQAVQRSLHWLDRVAGLMFMGFGLRLALAENPTR